MEILSRLASFIWGMPMIICLTACGVYFTVKLRAPQIRLLPKALKLLFKGGSEKTGISPFSALCTSLGAAAGTGNIVGVAAAVSVGGLGALFWMFAVSLLMMAVQYAECFLAVKFAYYDEKGNRCGGPTEYIRRAFGKYGKAVAAVFAVATVLTTAVGMGSFPQIASIKEGVSQLFGVSPYVIAPILTAVMLFLLFGGVKAVSRAASVVVPLTAVIYTVSCIGILIINAEKIPFAVAVIVKCAFCGQSAVGGFVGAGIAKAVKSGVSKGIFTNEAGLGSTPMAAAISSNTDPVEQGLVSMTGTFFDTLIMCSMTGLVLAVTDTWMIEPMKAVTAAFEAVYGKAGGVIVEVSLILLAMATLMGWSVYGEACTRYLFGRQGITAFRLCFCGAVFFGCFVSSKASWLIADIANAFMLIPNMLAVMKLSRNVNLGGETHRVQIHKKQAEKNVYIQGA